MAGFKRKKGGENCDNKLQNLYLDNYTVTFKFGCIKS